MTSSAEIICQCSILSRPIRNGSFEVMFYLDLSGKVHDPAVSALLSDLTEHLEYFQFLGNYGEN